MTLTAIGTSEFLLGFRLAGARTVLADASDAYAKIRASEGVVIMDATLAKGLAPEERSVLEASVSPVVIVLGTSDDEEQARLKRTMRATLGVDL